MSKKILIFGGSGFLGSSLVRSLLSGDFEVCVVCTDTKKACEKLGEGQNLQIKNIDIFDEIAVKNLVKKYDVIVNLIGKLFEKKKGDFAKFHHNFVEILLRNISSGQKFIHVSALGIEDSCESSIYAKTKMDGQNAVVKKSKNYNIIKPSIVFGEGDGFFNLFGDMVKFSPFLPLIGSGKARFSPVYVEDLTKAIIALINDEKKYKNQIFEAFGNKSSSFKELMKFILKTVNKKRILLNLPFSIAKIQAKFLNFLRIYLLTSDQVELLKYDNVASKKYQNIDEIIGEVGSYEKIVPSYLGS